MRLVFMGSDEVAGPSLDALAAPGPDALVAVITQPDRPQGRQRRVAPCPLRARALELGLPTFTPEKIGAPDAVATLRDLAPDVVVVVAYGQYLPAAVRAIPPRGIINLHPSLLPRYRGAAPIQAALANGDTQTGVTILDVDEKMDTGAILLQEAAPILADDTALTLGPRLAAQGAALLVRALDLLRHGRETRRPQEESLATHAPKLTKDQGRLDWALPAAVLCNRVRAYVPWPGCFCEAPAGSGQHLRIWRAAVEAGIGQPGEVLDVGASGPLVAAGAGALRLLEVQPEGRRVMPGADYARGARLEVGARLA